MDLFSILDDTPEPPIVDLHLGEINTLGVYYLATPMFEFQKELTDQIVSLHYPDILKHCETNDTTELITKLLEICVANCMLVATHPYLLIQHYMPKNLALRDLAAKLCETSGNFSVLRNLINVIISNDSASRPKHVAVVLSLENRLFDIVEALLWSCSGPKTILRYSGNNIKKDTGKSRIAKDVSHTTIHLIPADGEYKPENNLDQTMFDVILIMDGNVATDSVEISTLRNQNRATPAVAIRLVPIYSIEHCLVHYANQNDNPKYLYKLILSIVCLRDRIGNLMPDILPIYNRHLTFLSHTFFDHVFVGSTHFPAWPLPELPPIPRFSPTDVERSLLTEVVFHYTPYDSTEVGTQAKRKTFYETKRLQLDYVSNPLKNDYSTLSGIRPHQSGPKETRNPSILTHLLLLDLNGKYADLAVVNEELSCYRDFTTRENAHGRRINDIKSVLSNITEDVDHAELRLEVTQRKIARRQQENEDLEASMKEVKDKLQALASDTNTESIKGKFIARQMQIWESKHEVKNAIDRLKLKSDEKSYMARELLNCEQSIEQLKRGMMELEEEIIEAEKKLIIAKDKMKADVEGLEKQKLDIVKRLKAAEEENERAKRKLDNTFKYLRETSHLKKRKGRGFTPMAR